MPDNEAVVVGHVLRQVADPAVKAGERPEELAATLSQRTGAQVHVDFFDGPTSIDLTAYGGADLLKDFQTPKCTSGFPAITNQGLTGVMTAGHCVPSLPEPDAYYDGLRTDIVDYYDIALHSSHVGQWGDVAFYTTPTTEAKYFWYGNGLTLRQQIGTKSTWAAGDPISWYGRATRVTQSNTIYWYNVDNGKAFHLGCAIGGTGTPGDSGGPAFYGSTAAGFISSLVTINGAQRVCFSQARYIDEALGAISLIGG
jgi:streptogrisin C